MKKRKKILVVAIIIAVIIFILIVTFGSMNNSQASKATVVQNKVLTKAQKFEVDQSAVTLSGQIMSASLEKNIATITIQESALSSEPDEAQGLNDAILLMEKLSSNIPTIEEYKFNITDSNANVISNFDVNLKDIKSVDTLKATQIEKMPSYSYKDDVAFDKANLLKRINNDINKNTNLSGTPTVNSVKNGICNVSLNETDDTSKEVASTGLNDAILIIKQISSSYPSVYKFEFTINDSNNTKIATFDVDLNDINNISSLTADKISNGAEFNYNYTEDASLDQAAASAAQAATAAATPVSSYSVTDIENTINNIPVGDFENVVDLGQGTYEINLGVVEDNIDANTQDALNDAVQILQTTIPNYPNINCYVFQAFDSNNNKIVFFDVRPSEISDLDDLTATQLMSLPNSNFWNAPADY